MSARSRLVLLSLLALAPARAALPFQAPPPDRVLPPYDIRHAQPAERARSMPGEQAGAALTALQQAAGTTLRVRWDRSGLARWVHAGGDPLAAPAGGDFAERARAFLAASPALFGPADRLALRYVETTQKGVTHTGFQQVLDGVPVDLGYARVDFDRAGRVIAAGASGLPVGFTARVSPRLRPDQAAARALLATDLGGLALDAPSSLAGQRLLFPVAALRAPVAIDLVWLPAGDDARLAWRARVEPPGYPALYEVLIDADSGELLRRVNLVQYADTLARVFTESPDHGPQSDELVYDDAVNVRLEWPAGWLFADLTEGNFTTVRDDRAADNEMTLGLQAQATPGMPQVFDPAYTADPFADLDLGLVNLFHNINVISAHLYGLGFDEAAGNFQVANFGRGGAFGDPVLGDAQDGADTLLDADPMNDISNNANFATDPDGMSGRMQMFLWDVNTAGTFRDSSLDSDVVYHEFLHGVSNRLVGGRGDALCLLLGQSGAMGEAWSDFYAGSYNDDPIIGEFSTQDPINGIRTAPMDADSYTYGDLCTLTMLGCEVHADGEIWAQALWEVRQAMIGVYGADQGRRLTEELVLAGMKFSICVPSFLDMRDAILLADETLYGGVHRCLLWQVFAQNGMGLNAQDNTGGDETMPVEDFTVPDLCLPADGRGQVDWQFDEVGCDATARVTVTDADMTLPQDLEIRSASGDLLTLPLMVAASGAPAYTTGDFPVVGVLMPADVDTGDAVLQALRGDTLTASYTDATDSALKMDAAQLVCEAAVEMLAYRYTRQTCDSDSVPEFPELPGFLDAGESAVLEIELANREPFAIEDAVVQLTSSNPMVSVVPAGPVTVGRLEAAAGSALAPAVIRFLVAADPAVMTGDTTDYSLAFQARGYDGPKSPIVRTVRLNLDYQVATQTFGEDFENASPTVALWSHGPTRTPPNGDEWDVVRCQSVSGQRSYKNGGGDPMCNDYGDDQGDPYLASPPFQLLPAGVEAARLSRLQFQHHVQLAVPGDPFGGVCDAEAVVVVLTNDPMAIDTTDPVSLLAGAVGAYTVLPIAGLDDNTAGFEPQDFDLTMVPLPGLDLTQDVYLSWVFVVDYTNSFVPAPGCTFFDEQGEGYYLDDVNLEWLEVTTVPQQTACSVSCLALAVPDPAALAVCNGPVDLSADDSLIINCGGELEYRWSGGDLGAPGPFTPMPDVTANPMMTERYQLEVQCSTDPACTDASESLVVLGGQSTGIGLVGNQLKMVRQAPAMLHLDWTGGALPLRQYNIHQAAVKQDVADAVIAATPPVAQPDALEVWDLPDPATDMFYEVFGRDPCTGDSVIP